MNKYKPNFNIKEDVIEIRVKSRGRTIWKDRCELRNRKKLEDIARVLKFKFEINLAINDKLDNRWFE